MASRVTSGDASGLLSLVLTLLHAFPVSVHHHTHWLPGRPPWALVSVTSQLAKAGLIAKGPLAHSSDSGLPAPGSQRPAVSARVSALVLLCRPCAPCVMSPGLSRGGGTARWSGGHGGGGEGWPDLGSGALSSGKTAACLGDQARTQDL